jgi:Asp-tRNA(Asn)/Glu-tRNA(Gln) amidotransferase B subunit
MLDSQSTAFAERVWEIAAQLGNSAPKIADDMMGTAFPLTCTQARQEGALRMLRTGIITEVKRILRNRGDTVSQSDFADICEAFAPLIKDLRSKSYFVESAEEYVGIPDLIAEPELLDDARRFMRRKGVECIAEADRLDALFVAVTSNEPDAASAHQEVLA